MDVRSDDRRVGLHLRRADGTVEAAFNSNESLNVPLKVQVPIHTTYITAWSNRQGTVSFRDDVYGYDAQGKVTFDS